MKSFASEQPENDGCGSNSTPNAVESEPMECSSISDDSNEFSIALRQLKTLAHQNSFTIHECTIRW